MTDFSPLPISQGPPTGKPAPYVARAREAATALEVSFLSEMLKAAGFGEQVRTFSGGAGEGQFASFHRDAIARRMVRAGGIGLSEQFFKAMMEAQNGD